MTNAQVSKLLTLANAFSIKLADEKGTVVLDDKSNINQRFHIQREMLEKFQDIFSRKLRAILGELDGDILTLRERKFDPKMWRLVVRVKSDLEEIFKPINNSKPYVAAQKLVNYVANKTAILDNLDFLIQQHLQATESEVRLPMMPGVRHAQVKAFKELKELAGKLQQHMENNPLLPEPISTLPAREINPMADPSFLAPPDVATKA